VNLWDLRLARFDADGREDVIGSRGLCCAETDAVRNELYLFAGAAEGGLRELATLAVDAAPAVGYPIDFDGDGLSDVLALTPGALYAFANDGQGAFTSAATTDLSALGSDATLIALRDFDADGFEDLLFGYNNLETLERMRVLLGDGAGGFGAPIDTQLPEAGSSVPPATRLHATDVEYGDWLLVSVGDGTFSVASLPGGEERRMLRDMNADGRPDLLSGSDGRLQVFLTEPDGAIPTAASYELVWPAQQGSSTLAPPFHDFDGDGRLDLLSQDQRLFGSDSVSIQFGRDDGSFEAPWVRELGVTYNTTWELADLDGDGATDILSRGYASTDHPYFSSFSVRCGGGL
jgi:hypothetical protein